MEPTTAPVRVADLPEQAAPTPLAGWIKAAKIDDLRMPIIAALTMLIVASGAAGTLLVTVIAQRVTS